MMLIRCDLAQRTIAELEERLYSSQQSPIKGEAGPGLCPPGCRPAAAASAASASAALLLFGVSRCCSFCGYSGFPAVVGGGGGGLVVVMVVLVLWLLVLLLVVVAGCLFLLLLLLSLFHCCSPRCSSFLLVLLVVVVVVVVLLLLLLLLLLLWITRSPHQSTQFPPASILAPAMAPRPPQDSAAKSRD